MDWHSGEGHRLKSKSFTPARIRWWGMFGAVAVIGATAYFSLGPADGESAAANPLDVGTGKRDIVVDAAAHHAQVSFLRMLAWQDLPVTALEGPHDPGTAERTAVLLLQESLEREKHRADAALRELTAVREQLAGLEENEAMMAEYRSAALQESERTASALSRIAALQQELIATKEEAAKAQEAAEREKEKSSLAARHLGAVQSQLAALKSQGVKKAAAESEPPAARAQAAAVPEFGSRTAIPPAAVIFQVPLIAHASADSRSALGSKSSGPDAKTERRPAPNARQSALQSEPQAPAKTIAPETKKPERALRSRSTASDAGTSVGSGQRPRRLARNVQDAQASRGPELPSALRPDDGLW